MKRRLFSSSLSLRAAGNLLAAVSLVMCVATVALWVRSRFFWDEVIYSTSSGDYSFGSVLGSVFVMATNRSYRIPGWGFASTRLSPSERGTHPLGFGLVTETNPESIPSQPFRRSTLALPCWLLLLIFGAVPIARWTLLRRERQRIGRCATCGYDLRASK